MRVMSEFEDGFKLTHQTREGRHWLNISIDQDDLTEDYPMQPIEISPEQWDQLKSAFMVKRTASSGVSRLMWHYDD